MKKLVLLLTCLLLGSFTVVGQANSLKVKTKPIIVNTSTDKVSTLKKMTQELSAYDVIFFGEYHDQASLHKLEADLLEELYILHGNKLVLSLEMFEADQQDTLNKYLDGKITETEFLATARPWPNYETDYKPLVEFAKTHKLPVIAANIPRFLAAHLAKNGSLDAIDEKDSAYLPRHTYAPEGKYKEKFMGYMSGMNNSMAAARQRVEQMFAAQSLKDDKMAESIFAYREANPNAVVLHVNGSFHSDAHLGTAEKLAKLDQNLKIGVISPKYMEVDGDYLKNYATDKKDGEYIIYVVREEKNDEQK
ncbi:MAG TPA: ChaN family lipoprotein [Candidatus Avacidaminococcus intestinavium]|uniref:ChaN family lipoprotein n=1 Tax=Candidatus Avacidaminococcus intestinavium TaxID=2840684 RepID=A0A9D1MNL7_9FIRM|nr:ChaN family lipoprotein [Candidatus Avacidaminococcus intestinavium]